MFQPLTDEVASGYVPLNWISLSVIHLPAVEFLYTTSKDFKASSQPEDILHKLVTNMYSFLHSTFLMSASLTCQI